MGGLKIGGFFLKSAVALCTVLFFSLLLTWEPDRSLTDLAARWAPAPSRFIAIDGLQVHVRDEGPAVLVDDKPPIVLLHGTSASLHTWDAWAEQLKTQRRVIRFDLPGFGLTGPFKNSTDYSMKAYVGFVTKLISVLEVKQFVVVGNSLGGEIAWNLAAAMPDRVVQLALIDAAGYRFEPKSMPIGFRIATIPVLNRMVEFVLPRFLVASSVRNVYGDPSKVTDALVDRYFELTLREGNRKALPQRFAYRFSSDENAIKHLNMPTLVMWGRLDKLIPLDSAEKFKRDLTNSQLIIFDHLGHVPQEEDPAATLAAFTKFLHN